MADIYDWSVIAADNDDADAAINWMEGQFPDTVNNSARQMMARIAEWIKDQGILTATGAANAIAVATTNTARTTPVNGMAITFKAALSNTGASTLAINGGGAIALRKIYAGDTEASSLDAGDVTAQGVYVARYDSGANSNAGAWILVNPTNQAEMQALITTALGGAATKDTPVDADAVVITDSADSGKTKRVLWSSIKTTLKAYFDSIYQAALGFTPVQQGGGAGQVPNKIYIGWRSSNRLGLQVDTTSFADTWPISVSGDAATVGGQSWSNIQSAINSGDSANATNISDRIIRDQASHAGFIGGDENVPYLRVGTTGAGNLVRLARYDQIPGLVTNTNTGVGGVGSFAFLLWTGSVSAIGPGINVPGNELQWTNVAGVRPGSPSGSWRLCGYAQGGSGASDAARTSLWVRYA